MPRWSLYNLNVKDFLPKERIMSFHDLNSNFYCINSGRTNVFKWQRICCFSSKAMILTFTDIVPYLSCLLECIPLSQSLFYVGHPCSFKKTNSTFISRVRVMWSRLSLSMSFIPLAPATASCMGMWPKSVQSRKDNVRVFVVMLRQRHIPLAVKVVACNLEVLGHHLGTRRGESIENGALTRD